MAFQDHQQADSRKHVAVSKTRARQGVTGHNVRFVLVFGTAGIIIAFAIIYFIFFGAQ